MSIEGNCLRRVADWWDALTPWKRTIYGVGLALVAVAAGTVGYLLGTK